MSRANATRWPLLAVLALLGACADDAAPAGAEAGSTGGRGFGDAALQVADAAADAARPVSTVPRDAGMDARMVAVMPSDAGAPGAGAAAPADGGATTVDSAVLDASGGVDASDAAPCVGGRSLQVTRVAESNCDYRLDASVDADAACTGSVMLNGAQLQCNGDDGWRLVEPALIRLQGAACAAVLSGAPVLVEAAFPCSAVLP